MLRIRLLAPQKVITITSLIKTYLKEHNISQAKLSELLQESRQNTANKLRKRDLDSEFIGRVSVALNHDFFQILSQQWRTQLKNPTPAKGSKPDAQSESALSYVTPEYVRLLEAHNVALQENLQLYRQLDELRKE